MGIVCFYNICIFTSWVWKTCVFVCGLLLCVRELCGSGFFCLLLRRCFRPSRADGAFSHVDKQRQRHKQAKQFAQHLFCLSSLSLLLLLEWHRNGNGSCEGENARTQTMCVWIRWIIILFTRFVVTRRATHVTIICSEDECGKRPMIDIGQDLCKNFFGTYVLENRIYSHARGRHRKLPQTATTTTEPTKKNHGHSKSRLLSSVCYLLVRPSHLLDVSEPDVELSLSLSRPPRRRHTRSKIKRVVAVWNTNLRALGKGKEGTGLGGG